jgi:3-oxoacyl-[acyl-carrier-protein] synthase II
MNARDIRIRGVGAVSAAGWNAEALYKAVRAGTPLPATDCKRPGDERTWPCETRRAPAAPPEKITRHPRLRRSSAITRYSVTAALEALADAGHDPAAPPQGLGILFIMMNGCVNYTGRFYHEVLQNPAQASPLIFPETVFNAPASHIASFLGIDGAVSTLVGSPNSIMEALDTAAFWIAAASSRNACSSPPRSATGSAPRRSRTTIRNSSPPKVPERCCSPPSGDGPRVRDDHRPAGLPLMAGALAPLLPELAAQTRAKLSGEAILIDDRTGISKLDRAEAAAWSGSPWNAVLSPKLVLGESMGASAALQLVLGTFTARETQQPVVISMPGTNTAAYACVISL